MLFLRIRQAFTGKQFEISADMVTCCLRFNDVVHVTLKVNEHDYEDTYCDMHVMS